MSSVWSPHAKNFSSILETGTVAASLSGAQSIGAAEPGAVCGSVVAALVTYYAGSLAVLLGVVVGFEHLARDRHASPQHRDPMLAFSRWDGRHHTRIASDGYEYDPDRRSIVAFFPLYPMLGGALASITGLRTEIALLIVSNAFLIACLILLHAYVAHDNEAHPDTPFNVERHEGLRSQRAAHTLIAFSFWPTTFFFRMTYTESVFLFFAMLALYGMRRRWRLWLIAVICGLDTAARPVGVALVLPFALHIWRERLHDRRNFRTVPVATLLCVVACWGLLAYMLYQQVTFGDALGFAKTQQHWTMRPVDDGNKLAALVMLEPLWSVYVPGSDGYWAQTVPTIEPLFNLQAANPIYFVTAIGLIAYGARRRWLNAYEVLLSAGLILIPYVTRSYEMAMASQGRYVAAAFPMYIVMGELLHRVPSPWSTLIIAPIAVLMAIYAALFAAGFVVI